MLFFSYVAIAVCGNFPFFSRLVVTTEVMHGNIMCIYPQELKACPRALDYFHETCP